MTDRETLLRQLGHDRIMALLSYNPSTGVFIWRVSPTSNVKAGSVAGSKYSDGYRYIGVDGRYHKAHRLAWLYMTGEWPVQDLDHKNRTRDDNRWINLRLATPSQNAGNANTRANLSGLKGVSKKDNKWMCRIRINGVLIYLGLYDDKWEAARAYRKKATEVFGEFANGG